MARPFTRAQALQNAAFFRALAATGNARLAARELGFNRSTFTKRRARSAAFAAEWDAALLAAQAALERGDGRSSTDRPRSPGLRTEGGEPIVTRLKNGRLQLRLARPGRMTKAAEQAFFAALSASANVRLSAAAAGFAHSSFYARRRKQGAFAREMRLALAMGYERLEVALLMAGAPDSHADDAWRRNDPPPIPPMTADQALQLLFLHEKSVRQGWELPHRRRRRGEPWETYTERLRAMWTAEKAREAEDAALRRAAHFERSGDWRYEEERALPALPALEQVTGWSKADPDKVPHDPDQALFGGWRIEHLKKRRASGG